MTDRDDFIRNFPVTIDIDVQWGEMDAFGHVNNAVYLRYFESARIAYMRHVAGRGVFDLSRILPVLADTSCRFLRPLRYPDHITVGCTITELHEYGFSQEYEILSAEQQRVVTTGVARIVLLDKHSQQKALVGPELHDEIKLLESLR
ncbi:acyl-CoA thioesterase [Gilvimarinus algae]|uniref:Acyl-CoA thioesterase n=1 Tax=Gilvimarinus algae TaxID=3058037 RepID=A0ABT8TED4_9GAMM|nr:acyl-CoA thioesterase [Gilvimarinus sp. SDUM040014]MDO3381985.1 acyl-CoA thioesterase [Gilvimarinus sp. SDUM040014]